MSRSVLFLLPDLSAGGAERILTGIAAHFAGRGVDASLIVLFRRGQLLSECTPIEPKFLSASRTFTTMILTLPIVWWRLRQTLKTRQFDAILVTLTGTTIFTMVAWLSAGRPGRLVVREANTWRNIRNPVLRLATRILFPRADHVISVSTHGRDDLIFHAKVDPQRISVIPNPTDADRLREMANEPVSHPWLGGRGDNTPVVVGVGRLAYQKGFDVLLEAVSILAGTQAPRVILIGEGPMKRILEGNAERLGISDRVDFIGYDSNPYKYMRAAGIVACPSRWEGYPNVVQEAVCVGARVVISDCPGAGREILARFGQGEVLPSLNPRALASALRRQLSLIGKNRDSIPADFPTYSWVTKQYMTCCRVS